MAFEEIRFPTALSYGSSGGPGRSTRIIVAGSGFEDRNANWDESRRSFDITYGTKQKAGLEAIIIIWEAVDGPLTGFRFRDPMDWKSCLTADTPTQTDQTLLASATGGEATTQIIKNYTFGGQATARDITKPVNGTVLIERTSSTTSPNTQLLTEGVDYTIDYTTGIITWSLGSPEGLTASDVIKAGFEFDIPVRFANDSISMTIEELEAGSASIPIVEIKV